MKVLRMLIRSPLPLNLLKPRRALRGSPRRVEITRAVPETMRESRIIDMSSAFRFRISRIARENPSRIKFTGNPDTSGGTEALQCSANPSVPPADAVVLFSFHYASR